MSFIKNLKMEEANPDGGAGGGNPPAAPVTPAEQPPAPAAPPVKAEGDTEFDQYGYPKNAPADATKKEGEAPKAGDTPPEAPITKIAEVKEPGTGYGDEPPKVEDLPPAPVAPPAAPADADEYDKVLADIPKEAAKEIKDFATENKIPPEVAAKWGAKVKADIEGQKAHAAAMERQAEQQKNLQRKQWHDELKADPTFGGEKFQANVVRAEKVLAEFMPQTKKFLTERKSMLPPYVMRDLAKMADHLYATDRLNTGEPLPKTETPDQKNPIDDFYS